MFVKKLMKAADGFTLVEMTVVIAIIAVLAALALPAVTGVTTTSRGTSKTGDQKAVQQSVARYGDANGGKYPSETHSSSSDFAQTVAETTGDGIIKILVDNTAVSGTGTPTADVTCSGTSTALALAECFGAIKFSLLVPDYLSGGAKHATDTITATSPNTLTGAGTLATAEFTIENCDLAGNTCEIYLDDAEVMSLNVWNINKDGTAFTLKEDSIYGK